MARTRRRRILSCLRWLFVIIDAPIVWWACISHPLTQPVPWPQQQTDLHVVVSPIRQLDLVFMIDNSPSMAPKQEKLKAQFPKLIDALKDPNDQTLPDLRVAIIDSDLGTGNAITSGWCGPKTLPDGTQSVYGDMGRFQMIRAADCGVTDPAAMWLETKSNQALNFNGPASNISSVFGCLAGNLGTMGCGEEHQLQAFEFALVAKKIGNDQQQTMLRQDAYLGLVFLSDEDDCSAATNDAMFASNATLLGESSSLRCSTRSYACEGKNLTDFGPGYPTTQAYQTDFANCVAREDACPNGLDSQGTDTSVATDCSPLRDIRTIAKEIKALKERPDDQILVAGIFGWPVGGDMKNAEPVKFALRPAPEPADPKHPQVYDYWPFCYDPNHRPKAATTDQATGFDDSAAGWGAGPGVRESAFIDQFGDNGMKFSICETDYAGAMSQIGIAIAKHLQDLCVNYRLYDSDLGKPGLQPDCTVVYEKRNSEGAYEEYGAPLSECTADATSATISKDCWQLVTDPNKCPGLGQWINILRPQSEIQAGPLPANTKINMSCLTCTDDFAGEDKDSDVYRACHQ